MTILDYLRLLAVGLILILGIYVGVGVLSTFQQIQYQYDRMIMEMGRI